MFLSLITVAVYLVNAAGFLLLRPGADLIEYIASSSIYSMLIWINLWIAPSAFAYDAANASSVRNVQLLIGLSGAGLLLATHPSLFGLCFAVLLALETLMFYSFPLLYRSDTRLTQRIELARASLATFSLLLTVFVLGAEPRWHSLLLVGFGGTLGLVLVASGIYRPPGLHLAAVSVPTAARDLLKAFGRRSLHALVGARLLEVGSILAASGLGALGVIIAVKIGVAFANGLCINARRFSLAQLLAVLSAAYGATCAIVLLLPRFPAPLVPETLRILTPLDCLVGFPVAVGFLALAIRGICGDAAVPADGSPGA